MEKYKNSSPFPFLTSVQMSHVLSPVLTWPFAEHVSPIHRNAPIYRGHLLNVGRSAPGNGHIAATVSSQIQSALSIQCRGYNMKRLDGTTVIPTNEDMGSRFFATKRSIESFLHPTLLSMETTKAHPLYEFLFDRIVAYTKSRVALHNRKNSPTSTSSPFRAAAFVSLARLRSVE